MSYQFPPAGDPNAPYGSTQPVVQQPAAPFAPAPGSGGRRTGLIAVGVLVLAAGVAAGIVMMLASGKNYDESVQNLARAPINCTTSLQFDQTGTFTVYVETKGTVGAVRGDCPNADDDFAFTGDHLPTVDVTLTDPSGDVVDLSDDFDKSYDAGDAVGQSIASVSIDETGDYDITVATDDQEFAISVGKNPKGDADSLRTNGLIVGIAGLVVGGIVLLLGLRRRTPAPPPGPTYAAAAPQAPAPAPQAWVTGPPAGGPPPPPPAPGWPPAAPPARPSGPQLNPPNWPAPPPAS